MHEQLKLDLFHPVLDTVQAYSMMMFNADYCQVHDGSEMNFLCDESDDCERWDPNFSDLRQVFELRSSDQRGPRRI
jgi:hypothetical protein